MALMTVSGEFTYGLITSSNEGSGYSWDGNGTKKVSYYNGLYRKTIGKANTQDEYEELIAKFERQKWNEQHNRLKGKNGKA